MAKIPATLVDEDGRECTKCGVYKPWGLFYKRKKPHGLQYYHNECIECFRKHADTTNLRRRRALKLEVLAAYGGACACCAETEPLFLTIDHINNDGAEHRRSLGGNSNGLAFYYWLRRNNWPPGFQVLCWNCNSGRHINGGICPHVSIKISAT